MRIFFQKWTDLGSIHKDFFQTWTDWGSIYKDFFQKWTDCGSNPIRIFFPEVDGLGSNYIYIYRERERERDFFQNWED